MSQIPMILLCVMQHKVDESLFKFCCKDRSLPFALRSQVINQYRRQARRELCAIS